LGYPEALLKAVEADTYSRGNSDYSVTQLLKPPRVVALEALHKDEMVDDVSDRIWSLYGQIVHTILERANEADLVEKRFFAEFQGPKKLVKVSAQLDSLSLKDSRLTDWKFTTVWKFLPNKPVDADWTAQLNMQLEILRRNGLNAERLQIVGLLRDWSKTEASRNSDYPQRGVVTQPIEIWSREQTTAFIEERISLMEAARKELPLCTPTERWAKQDIWAVMKGERAIRMGLCFSEKNAIDLCKMNPGTRIEFRPGQSPRCEHYCAVSEWCDQYKAMKEKR
jgi:hypothetical protein